VFSEQTPPGGAVLEAVRESIGILFGELGVSRIHLTPIFYDEARGEGIMRCNHEAVWNLRVAIAFVDHVGPQRASIIVRGVSGTLRAADAKFLSGTRV
jgi:RNase P/RNase MRP subunit POP5